MHGVISLPSATSYDKKAYKSRYIEQQFDIFLPLSATILMRVISLPSIIPTTGRMPNKSFNQTYKKIVCSELFTCQCIHSQSLFYDLYHIDHGGKNFRKERKIKITVNRENMLSNLPSRVRWHICSSGLSRCELGAETRQILSLSSCHLEERPTPGHSNLNEHLLYVTVRTFGTLTVFSYLKVAQGPLCILVIDCLYTKSCMSLQQCTWVYLNEELRAQLSLAGKHSLM